MQNRKIVRCGLHFRQSCARENRNNEKEISCLHGQKSWALKIININEDFGRIDYRTKRYWKARVCFVVFYSRCFMSFESFCADHNKSPGRYLLPISKTRLPLNENLPVFNIVLI